MNILLRPPIVYLPVNQEEYAMAIKRLTSYGIEVKSKVTFEEAVRKCVVANPDYSLEEIAIAGNLDLEDVRKAVLRFKIK